MGMNPVTRTVVLAAKNLVRFVSVDSSGAKPAIKARNGVIGKAGTAQAFLSLAFSPEGLTLTGCMECVRRVARVWPPQLTCAVRHRRCWMQWERVRVA